MSLHAALVDAVGADGVIAESGGRAAYAYEAGMYADAARPDFVVLPRTTQQVAAVVRAAAAAGAPIVARGSGTGLCGGSLAVQGGVVVALTRMNRILHVDAADRRAVVQPGVINAHISDAAKPFGFAFAPDPSSQKISTIGGNVACNAGGPHCLAYGSTTNHILGLTFVTAQGDIVSAAASPFDPGIDLVALLAGSEGTLGIVTEITVKLMPEPAAVRVALAPFDSIDDACRVVSTVIARGILPSALEIIDRMTAVAVEAAFAVGYPTDCDAVLLIEVDGMAESIDERLAEVADICAAGGAREVRLARTQTERDALWAGRKAAAGAFGRIAPNFYIQDGVVPRTRLPAAIARVREIGAHYRLRIANVFHAGDGNLHPNILFDRRDRDEVARVITAGTQILQTCVAMGGIVSGEHGIGVEKRNALELIFSSDDLAAMAKVKGAFNPSLLFNPGKVFPSSRRCAELLAIAARGNLNGAPSSTA